MVNSNLFQLKIWSECESGPILFFLSGEPMKELTEGIIEKLKEFYENREGFPFTLVEVIIPDWDRYLTPWKVEECLKNRDFQGEGRTLLQEIEQKLISELKEKYPNSPHIYIAGYSLAGLFSLWAMNESTMIDGAVSCSGSFWYPEWNSYAKQAFQSKKEKVFLSLGKKEPKTKHPIMKKVGENTLELYEKLTTEENVKHTEFIWREGGHFTEVEERMVQGIQWILG